MLHTFTVPVKPHVRKYLEFHLGQGYKLSQLDPFGRELKTLLGQKKKNKWFDGFTRCYTANFGVSVEGNMILQKRLKGLTAKEIIDFNNFVEGIIKWEFFGFVSNRCLVNMSHYSSIQAFREQYDFQDEDMSYDTLKKAWQRYKSPTKKQASSAPQHPGNSINLVSVCPLPMRAMAA
ncbi:MAG: hypothetical protein EOO63_06840 [Hymenobacter sp.]|nr:MAG: hypothetical protein EOO63_06840 [Hymenobacter sp.]